MAGQPGLYSSAYDFPPTASAPMYDTTGYHPLQGNQGNMSQGDPNYFTPPRAVPIGPIHTQQPTTGPGIGMVGNFNYPNPNLPNPGPPQPVMYMYPPGPGGGQPYMQPPPYGQYQHPGMPPPVFQQPHAQFQQQQVTGLEPLLNLDKLFVKQKVELLEAFLGCETKNKYTIRNARKEKLFTAKEDTDCCTRNLCGPLRPFDIKIKDDREREIIHLERPLACNSCLCPCLLQSIDVYAPVGQLAGRVVQEWTICSPSFSVQDADGNVVLRIEGPACTYSICGDVEFPILGTDGSLVGKISKEWSGVLREAFTDSDNFGISFPMDLDVRMKAVMLGAAFLIDFMFFEKSGNQENDGLGMLS